MGDKKSTPVNFFWVRKSACNFSPICPILIFLKTWCTRGLLNKVSFCFGNCHFLGKFTISELTHISTVCHKWKSCTLMTPAGCQAPKLLTVLLSPFSERSHKKDQYYLINGKHLCSYIVKLSFFRTLLWDSLNGGDFLGTIFFPKNYISIKIGICRGTPRKKYIRLCRFLWHFCVVHLSSCVRLLKILKFDE